ncbi:MULTISPECIES: hypothetical protein [Marinitoga]|uniref:hypothetical protein n=1 Tax=Marinitoga TaxID=160798 RepID=UPI0013E9F13C|nr:MULTISPECIES: hypothetical protein [Marinitoga]KAF2956193.1 hypothetical protein AS160_06870 [Marinitoga sp. 38H-ov]MBM7559309.1 putative Zn-dependent protease [Marinitoga litoralis]
MLTQKYRKIKASFVKNENIFVFNIIDIFFKEQNYSFGRRKKYSDKSILKILILLKMAKLSYRKSENLFRDHPEFLSLIGIEDIPSFQTILYRTITLEK